MFFSFSFDNQSHLIYSTESFFKDVIIYSASWPSVVALSFVFTIRDLQFFLYIFQAERDGSNEYNNYQPGALNTTDQLIKDLRNIDIVFHIGDITYANGYISQWDQFTSQVEPIASTVPYMIARLVYQ